MRHKDLVVVGAIVFGDQGGIDELVALFLIGGLEADRKGLQTRLTQLCQQADDEAGIHPTGQQHPDRYIGDHAALHGNAQGIKHLIAPVRRREPSVFGPPNILRRPVEAVAMGAVGFKYAQGRRRQFAHALQDGVRRWHHSVEGHVVVQGDRSDRGVHVSARQQRRQAGGEPQPLALFRQIQRLDAEPVAPHHHTAAVALMDDEGEHAVEAVDAGLAPGMPRLEEHLAVAVGEEAIAHALQLGAQFGIVIDAAVEDHHQAEVGIDHRLLGLVAEVDDL